MNSADIIARRLHAAGCRTAFGIPGGEVLTLIDALERAGIRFILTKHENSAGFMAEGTWHATGAPGILVATVGPGIANAFNVVANAAQDRVPLIVISGMIDPAEAMRYTHQVFDQSAVMRQVCKASFTAPDGAIGAMIDKALSIATSGRPGPVHIDLPIAVAAAEQIQPPVVLRGPPLPSAPAPGAALDRARAMFAASRRPVIMAGLDALNEPGGADALRAFAEKHAIPVVTTYKAKGVLPEDHPLALGGHGLSPKSEKLILPLFEAADLVIAAGYDPIEMRIGWQDPWDPAKAIEFAHAANDHDMHYAALSWVSSVAGGLAALDGAPKQVWPDGEPARIRAELAEAFAPKGDWGPDHAVAEILAAVPPEVTVTIDTGAHRILISQMWRAAHPRGVLQSTGLCTMGCALPLAMGFKHARPASPVIAFTGDAGLEMVLGELSTLRDLGLPVVIVVFVDQSLALIELKQRAMGIQNAGVDFRRTDFAAVARAYGGHGVAVSGPGEAGPAVAEALAAERFTIVAVEIPRRAYDGLI
ncbi:MAG TPA: thiamine pyrophosphate-binding protein [Thermohalobaculum sp.]|nr:thiamine pyrophosphate-binding protein [Thermohalobaculum sp.]